MEESRLHWVVQNWLEPIPQSYGSMDVQNVVILIWDV